jgi:hypothetical protein
LKWFHDLDDFGVRHFANPPKTSLLIINYHLSARPPVFQACGPCAKDQVPRVTKALLDFQCLRGLSSSSLEAQGGTKEGAAWVIDD